MKCHLEQEMGWEEERIVKKCKSKVIEKRLHSKTGSDFYYFCRECNASCDTLTQVDETHSGYLIESLLIENGMVTVITDSQVLNHPDKKEIGITWIAIRSLIIMILHFYTN